MQEGVGAGGFNNFEHKMMQKDADAQNDLINLSKERKYIVIRQYSPIVHISNVT